MLAPAGEIYINSKGSGPLRYRRNGKTFFIKPNRNGTLRIRGTSLIDIDDVLGEFFIDFNKKIENYKIIFYM